MLRKLRKEMYKEIIKWVLAIIMQPAKSWEILSHKEEKGDEFLSRFVYPLIGLVILAAFLGVMFTRREFDVALALKAAIRALVYSIGGFYISSYLLNEIWPGVFHRVKDMKLWQHFVGYASVLMYTLDIVLTLLPDFFFLRIFVLYTFYIVWEGAAPYMQVEENDRMKFVIITTMVILAIPYLIDKAMTILIPGLAAV